LGAEVRATTLVGAVALVTAAALQMRVWAVAIAEMEVAVVAAALMGVAAMAMLELVAVVVMSTGPTSRISMLMPVMLMGTSMVLGVLQA